MDGVAVMRELLIGNADLLTLVDGAADRIVAGILAPGTDLDALAIERISAVDRNIMAPGANRRVTERVQVTALAKTYPGQKALLKAVKRAAADFVGSAAGLTDVTVHTDAAGPDFMDEQSSIYMGSQDFIVGYTEPR